MLKGPGGAGCLTGKPRATWRPCSSLLAGLCFAGGSRGSCGAVATSALEEPKVGTHLPGAVAREGRRGPVDSPRQTCAPGRDAGGWSCCALSCGERDARPAPIPALPSAE